MKNLTNNKNKRTKEMIIPIPLTSNENITTVAAIAGVSPTEITKKLSDLKEDEKNRHIKDRVLFTFNEDEAWYDSVLEKIEDIKLSLPKEMNYKQQTIKTWGWLADLYEEKNKHSVPHMPLQDDKVYGRADYIELLFQNPDLLDKLMRWD